jgi:hypothetical protein
MPFHSHSHFLTFPQYWYLGSIGVPTILPTTQTHIPKPKNKLLPQAKCPISKTKTWGNGFDESYWELENPLPVNIYPLVYCSYFFDSGPAGCSFHFPTFHFSLYLFFTFPVCSYGVVMKTQ